MIFGIAAASVSCTDSSGLLLIRVKQGKRFTKYGLSMTKEKQFEVRTTVATKTFFNSYTNSSFN